MPTEIRDRNGKLVEIQENGETIWKADDSVRRDKISDKTLDEYVNASTVEKKVDILFEIVTGKKPSEVAQ